jgi:hypothetical protein
MTAQNIGFLSRILEEWRCIFAQLPTLDDSCSSQFFEDLIHAKEDYLLVKWEVRSNSINLATYATKQEMEEDLVEQMQLNTYETTWLPVMAYRLSTEVEFEVTPRGFDFHVRHPRQVDDGFRATFTEQQLERQAPV